MRVYETVVEQGSPAWHAARKGKVTASCFGRLFGTAKEKNAYLKQLREGAKSFRSEATTWGKANEEEARAQYMMATGEQVIEVGFMERADWLRVGASPDGIVPSKEACPTPPFSEGEPNIWATGEIIGGVEIKCPYDPSVHLRYQKYGIPEMYYWQVMGCMWVTGAEWWDFVSYNPRLMRWEDRLYYQRLLRDPVAFEQLEKALDSFLHVYKNEAWFVDVTPRAVLSSGYLSEFLKGKV